MNTFLLLASLLVLSVSTVPLAWSQSGVVRTLEPCACPVPVDSSFRTRCAYLIVPENRKKNNSKTIKLPFIVVESKNHNKNQEPLLFTEEGQGGN